MFMAEVALNFCGWFAIHVSVAKYGKAWQSTTISWLAFVEEGEGFGYMEMVGEMIRENGYSVLPRRFVLWWVVVHS